MKLPLFWKLLVHSDLNPYKGLQRPSLSSCPHAVTSLSLGAIHKLWSVLRTFLLFSRHCSN